MKKQETKKETKQMQVPEHLKDIPVECNVNGRKNKTLSIEEAYSRFWEADFAWNKLTDEFRSGSGKNAKQGFMMDFAQPSGTYFALKMLTRGSLALAVNDSCMLDEDGFEPTKDVFTANACKFGRCFKGEKIFKAVYIYDDKNRRQLAYRVRPGKKWIIILGLVPGSNLTNEEIEWEIFQTAPDKALSQSK